MPTSRFAPRFFTVILCVIYGCLSGQAQSEKQTVNTIQVHNTSELRAALHNVRPGTRIQLAPGEYAGGNWFTNVRGEAGRPIVIQGSDPENRPVIQGGTVGFQFAGAAFLELRDLDIRNIAGNGIMIDDGGVREQPAHHIVLHNLHLADIGPKGNHHSIKMAGVDDFRIENCHFERWGAGNGFAIDGVGCHRGVVENNLFQDRPELVERGFGGIQFKGGSREILIRKNRFEWLGMRAINIGGSTGQPYFRPALEAWPQEARYEAKEIIVEGNTFLGSDAPVAFVNVDGAIVRFNTIYSPRRWALRILQETRLPGFVPSRNGVFEDNIIVFQQKGWAEGGVNIGPGTAPETFRFARNFWFCENAPSRSRPTLLSAEIDGVYGQDPRFRSAAKGDLSLLPESPASGVGAEAMAQKEFDNRDSGI